MFFIGIFGIQEKERILKELNCVICGCGNYSKAELIEQYRYFHFFFIPLVKWHRRYFLRFRCCGRVYKVPEAEAEDMIRSEYVDIHQLEEVKGADSRGRQCPNCGSTLDHSFQYCPYCGKNLK